MHMGRGARMNMRLISNMESAGSSPQIGSHCVNKHQEKPFTHSIGLP